MRAIFVGQPPAGQACACVGCSRSERMTPYTDAVWRGELCVALAMIAGIMRPQPRRDWR